MSYEKLVQRVDTTELYRKKDGYHGDFTAAEGNPLKEINAWTYWQGIGVRHPRIMVLGQDWGNRQAAEKYFCRIEEMLEAGIAEKDRVFSSAKVSGILKNNRNFDTDENLAKGFSRIKIHGEFPYTQVCDEKYPDLFFTNLIPGYRVSEKSTGGFKASWITEQVRCDFKELLNVLQPKIVICLGKNTFIQAAKIYNHKNPLTGTNWNAYLNSDFEPIKITVDSHSNSSTFLYPMAHPGYFGKRNREKSVESMCDDWERLGEWMERHSI